mgnify:CR=1 FL=1
MGSPCSSSSRWRITPEAKNLVGIYAALSGKTAQEVLNEFGGKGFGAFKPALAEVVVEDLAAYERLLTETLLTLPNVSDIRSNFAIRSMKTHGALKLPERK